MERPELNRGTVDFAVPEAYWAQQPLPRLVPSFFTATPHPTGTRRPLPMRYVFVIDVSSEAVNSGMLLSTCRALKEILIPPIIAAAAGGQDAEPSIYATPTFPTQNQVAILTFDRTLHFYNLSVCIFFFCSLY